MVKRKSEIGQAIVWTGKRLAEQGLIVASDGNVSARLSRDEILVTPSGLDKGKLQDGHLVRVRLDGEVLGKGRPSSEIEMHLGIYRLRPDARAVVHAHPPYATAFAVSGISLTRPILPEAVLSLGPVPLVPYSTPGTPDVLRKLVPYLLSRKGKAFRCHAFLLSNHGAVTLGKDLEEALFRMERLELLAKVTCLARQLGGVKVLSRGQEQGLLEAFRLGG